MKLLSPFRNGVMTVRSMKGFSILVALFVILIVSYASGRQTGEITREGVVIRGLGRVRWIEDFDKALVMSREHALPLLVFAQEKDSSEEAAKREDTVLRHPLIVEMVEILFVPVAVRADSSERRVFLERLGEVTGDETVIMIRDSREEDLVPRLSWDGSAGTLLETVISAYRRTEKPVPRYVKILHGEHSSHEKHESAMFPVHCFWAGEVELGPEEGVLHTLPGRTEDGEAIEVVFDASVTSYGQLLEKTRAFGLSESAYWKNARQRDTAERVFGEENVKKAGRFNTDTRPKYYLSRTNYKYVPMTDRQAILVNSDLFFENDPARHLSGRQLQIFEYIDENSNRSWKKLVNRKSERHAHEDIIEKWAMVTERIEKRSRGEVKIH